MGIWVVEPDVLDNGQPWTAMIHLDTIVCLSHLLPIYRDKQAPRSMKYTDSLDTFSLASFQIIMPLKLLINTYTYYT